MIEKRNNPSANLVLFITTVTSFMTAFMGSSLNIALPVIGKEFNASALLLSWLSTLYLLVTAALLLPSGRFADIRGRIKSFKAGIIIFTAGTFFSSFSPGTTVLLISRGIQGIGSAFIFSTATAILVSAYPVAHRGKVLGINVASVYFGLSSGPFLGGLITQYLSWRAIFILTALLGIFLSFMTYRYLKFEWNENVNKEFDWTGSCVYGISIILIMTGLSLFPRLSGFVIFAGGIMMMGLFYNIEKAGKNSLFDFTVFRRNRTFIFSNTAALINYSATFAIGFLMSFYLQYVKGLSPKDAGLILVIQPLVQAVFSPLAGKISDKYEPQIVASSGMGVLTAGLIVFCFISPGIPIYIISINMALLGLGFALFSSPNTNAIMSSVEKVHYGLASSTLASVRVIGQMFSMGIVMVIFNIYIGSSAGITENVTGFLNSARTAFFLFSIISFLGIFASLSRGRIHN